MLLYCIPTLRAQNQNVIHSFIGQHTSVYLGLEYNITPITPDITWFYIGPWYPRFNENDLVTGNRIYYDVKVDLIPRLTFSFQEDFRYGMLYVKSNGNEKNDLLTGQSYLLYPYKGLTTSLNFLLSYKIVKRENSFKIGFGYSYMNIGSKYSYFLDDSNGNVKRYDTNLEYSGIITKVSAENKGTEIGVQLKFIPEALHNFVYFNNIFLPSIFFEKKIKFSKTR